MKAAATTETHLPTKLQKSHIPENHNLQIHCCDNLKSYVTEVTEPLISHIQIYSQRVCIVKGI